MPRRISIAKLSIPSTKGSVARTRLFKSLDEGSRPVTWISGPAGSGKTTLIASYCAVRRLPTLWYRADAGDGDPATFFYYLGLAARKAAPRRRKPLPLFTPEYFLGAAVFAQRYFEELFGRLPSRAAIVIDDYHTVAPDSPLHAMTAAGFGVLPEGIRVFVTSRSGPPEMLAGLRAQGRIDMLGWEDLKFTREETRALVRNAGHARPAPDLVAGLRATTDGWSAGLALLLERMKKRPLAGLAASHHSREEIFDYFASQILATLDEERRAFLLTTALLPEMTAAAAEDLSGAPRASRILSDFARDQFFTTRHARNDDVYLYHPLFREFLTVRAEREFLPDRLQALRNRAARILQREGRSEDAAALMASAGDWDGLAGIVREQAPDLVRQGRHKTVEHWLLRMPAEVVGRSGWLSYWRAVSAMPSDLTASLNLFERAFRLFEAEGDRPAALLAWSGAVEAIFLERGDFTRLDPWLAWIDEILGDEPEFPSAEAEVRVVTSVVIALTFRRPDHPRVCAWADRAFTLAQRNIDTGARMSLANVLVFFAVLFGDFTKVSFLLGMIRPLVRTADIHPLTAILWLSIDACARYWVDVSSKESLRAVDAGMATARSSGVRVLDFVLAAQGAHAAIAAGDVETAQRFLDEMAPVMATSRLTDQANFYYLLAWLDLYRGDSRAAARHAERGIQLAAEAGAAIPVIATRTGLSHALMSLGDNDAAEKQISLARCTAAGIPSMQMELILLFAEARLAFLRGAEKAGRSVLRKALVLSRDNRYWNMPYWTPGIMTPLCIKALDGGIEREYVRELIRKRNLFPEESLLLTENWPWPVEIRTLGRFEIVVDGKPHRSPGKVQQRPLQLLKALIAFGAREVSQPSLNDALWPDADGDLANQAFKTTLHRLRQLLGNEKAVVVSDGLVTLDQRHCRVDVLVFEQLAGEAAAASSAGATDQARVLLEKAAALYTGTFLPAEEGSVWAVSLRERLKAGYLKTIVRLGALYASSSNWDKAADCYQKALDTDDLAEEFYLGLMECHIRRGRPAEAARVYARCRNRLMAALGVGPSQTIEELHARLKR
ncbi:MAG: hypothetical protein OEW15_00575 [Nitrospirota bacterium]|nr:hypothetical protein [Nitrospirota bacterium]